MQCACDYEGDGPITLCPAHQMTVDKHVAAEREACALLADNMAVESKIAMQNFKALDPPSPDDAMRHDHYCARAIQIAHEIRARSTLGAKEMADRYILRLLG